MRTNKMWFFLEDILRCHNKKRRPAGNIIHNRKNNRKCPKNTSIEVK